MASKEDQRAIALGEWLEKYLNPNLKLSGYKELANEAISLYNMDIALNNDLSVKAIKIFCEQTNDVQGMVSNHEKMDHLNSELIGGLEHLEESSRKEDYDDLVLEIDNQPCTNIEKEALKTMAKIALVIDETKFSFTEDQQIWSKHDISNKIFYAKTAIFDFIQYKTHSNYALQKILEQNKLWSETFELELDAEPEPDSISALLPFSALYSNSLSIHNAIKIDKGVAKETTTFDTMTLYYANYSDSITLFPWGPVVSKILIDFLFLGGQDRICFCEQCGRFCVAKRKKRKEYCSNLCRTRASNVRIAQAEA